MDKETVNDIYIFWGIVPRRSEWFLDHPRLRTLTEVTGGVAYWREFGPPDFCDGEFESWICDLSVRGR